MQAKVVIRATAPLAVLALLSLPVPASAQVYKCVDSSGKTTFSDQGCGVGHAASAINVAPANTVDSSQYRNQPPKFSAPGLEADPGQTGVRVDVVGGDGGIDRDREQRCKQAMTPYSGSRGLTAAQLAAAAELCGSGSVSAPASAPSSRPVAAPSVITSCDEGGCWDSNGVRYNKGAGNTHFRATGGASCELVNGQMMCP